MSIIAYVRVSTSDQTVKNQEQQISEKFKIEKWFRDEAISGSTKASERQGFKQMFEYVREGDSLIVTAIDRLGRSVIDVLSTIEQLQKRGITVISLRENFDLSTPIGKAMLGMMSSLAQLEKDLIAERRTAGIKRAQAEGIHCGRPVKCSTEIVQSLFAAGKTCKEIMQQTGLSKASVYRLKKTQSQ